jgi:ABC-type Mn2+/Zn2+ transport system ATPase subunit
MSVYEQELTGIDSTRRNTARFFRVAFHCHSPLSFDWGKRVGADATLNTKEKYLAPGGEEEYCKLVKQATGCHVMIISDHMKCGYAEAAVRCVAEMADLVVLPGMEVNLLTTAALGSVRLHVIVILPPGLTRETFGRMLSGVPEEKDRTGTETIGPLDIKEWVSNVGELGGLCIAAHIESRSGARHCFRQTAKASMELEAVDDVGQRVLEHELSSELRNLIFDIGFDALEIRPGDRHHYRWASPTGEQRAITTVLGLDAHCVEDFARQDSITFVKMTEPGIIDLRSALKFAETRIRFPGDVTAPPSPTLVGITVNGSQESFFENLQVGFSENLNCIIGPRGAGKSTVVETLRYVFGYNRTVGELDQENRLSDRIISLQEATLSGSVIRLYYKTAAGELNILEATYDPEENYVTKVYDLKGDVIPVDDIERDGRYPLRLYGWSEIETLGRDSARQRSLLDRMIPGIADVIDRRADIKRRLATSRHEIAIIASQLKEGLKQDGEAIYRYSQYKKNFEKLDTADVKKQFEAIDFSGGQVAVYEKVISNVRTLKAKLEAVGSIDLTSGTEKILGAGGEQLKTWWQQEQLKDKSIIHVEQFVRGNIESSLQKVKELEELMLDKQRQCEKEVSRLYSELKKVFVDQPDQRRIADLRLHAKERLKRASAVRDSYLENMRKLKELLIARKRLVEELEQAQNEITGIRAKTNQEVEDRLNKFMDDKLKVGITMVPGGDRQEFLQNVERFLRSCSIRVLQRVLKSIAYNYRPSEFCKMVLELKFKDLLGRSQTVGGETYELSDKDVQTLEEKASWVEKQEGPNVPLLKGDGRILTSLLELQETTLDDMESILLNGKPVDKLSPGQRSSAMLPLIALAEESPLVIDQPEDNLDNRLIGKILVEILAELKEQRQIIVCTHNPNIVVLGDAEQVIVLEPESDRKGRQIDAGSIDKPSIVSTVIDVMEGGREAFEARKQRYEF